MEDTGPGRRKTKRRIRVDALILHPQNARYKEIGVLHY